MQRRGPLNEFIENAFQNVEGAYLGGLVDLSEPIERPVNIGEVEKPNLPDGSRSLHRLSRDDESREPAVFWFSVCRVVLERDWGVSVLYSTTNPEKYIGAYLLDAADPALSATKNFERIVNRAGQIVEVEGRCTSIEGQSVEETRWDLQKEARREEIEYIFIEDFGAVPSEPDEPSTEPLTEELLRQIAEEFDKQIVI